MIPTAISNMPIKTPYLFFIHKNNITPPQPVKPSPERSVIPKRSIAISSGAILQAIIKIKIAIIKSNQNIYQSINPLSLSLLISKAIFSLMFVRVETISPSANRTAYCGFTNQAISIGNDIKTDAHKIFQNICLFICPLCSLLPAVGIHIPFRGIVVFFRSVWGSSSVGSRIRPGFSVYAAANSGRTRVGIPVSLGFVAAR